MPRLWGRASSLNVQKVMWTLAELGIDHARIDAGGRYGKLDDAEFGRLNPTRRIPVWEDGSLVLWESNAIVRHLATTAPKGPIAHGVIADQWMEFASTTAQPPLLGAFYQTVRLPRAQRSQAVLDQHMVSLNHAMDVLDARLTGTDFVNGISLSTADIALGTLMYRYYDMDLPRTKRPGLQAWYRRLTERPAYAATVMTSYEELRAPE